MTDFRARCAELAQQLDDALDFTVSGETRRHMKALISTVRAELAEAGAEGPSGKELLAEAAKALGYLSTPPWEFDPAPMSVDDLLTVQRAAIAADRARRQPVPPEPEGPTDENPSEQEIADIAEDLEWRRLPQEEGSGQSFLLAFACAVLARWGRPTPQPVPVSERLPGPDDLGGFDSNCCWWGHWQDGRWIWVWDCEPVRNETHWLPASTPILPAGAIRQS